MKRALLSASVVRIEEKYYPFILATAESGESDPTSADFTVHELPYTDKFEAHAESRRLALAIAEHLTSKGITVHIHLDFAPIEKAS